MFIIDLTYTAPLERVDELMGPHVEYLQRHIDSGEFVAAGRKVPRTGGIILATVADRARAEEIAATDPFLTEGAATCEIVEFVAGRGKPEVLDLLNR